jgi:hypothetical protein
MILSCCGIGTRFELFDDSFDDNRDDSYCLSIDNYSPNFVLLRLVREPALSWQCGGHGFESR